MSTNDVAQNWTQHSACSITVAALCSHPWKTLHRMACLNHRIL